MTSWRRPWSRPCFDEIETLLQQYAWSRVFDPKTGSHLAERALAEGREPVVQHDRLGEEPRLARRGVGVPAPDGLLGGFVQARGGEGRGAVQPAALEGEGQNSRAEQGRAEGETGQDEGVDLIEDGDQAVESGARLAGDASAPGRSRRRGPGCLEPRR